MSRFQPPHVFRFVAGLLLSLALTPSLAQIEKPPADDFDRVFVPLFRWQARGLHLDAFDYSREPEGQVRFWNVASTSFDPWSYDPSPQQAQWMRDHYHRMLTWSTYFDKRTAWYSNAWAYFNVTGIWWELPLVTEHPEWILKDADGNRLFVPFDCDGKSCPRFLADFGNPAYHANWIERARAELAHGYRGLWMDDINLTWRASDADGNPVTPIDPRTGVEMTLTDWRRYLAEFAETVRAAFPDVELVHNVIWFAGSNDNDNEYITRQIRAADFINLERGVNDDGLVGGTTKRRFSLASFFQYVDYVHDLDRPLVFTDAANTLDKREYGLAGWLMISESQDMYSNETRTWSSPDHWWHGYGVNLGYARGTRYRTKGVWRRDFQCGTVLLNAPGAKQVRHLELERPRSTLEGQRVTHVSLGARDGVVLLDDCACIGARCNVEVEQD